MTLAVGGAPNPLAAFQTQPAAVQDAGQNPQAGQAALAGSGAQADPAAAILAGSAPTAALDSALADGLGQATSIADTAQAAAGSVVQLLQQLQQTATEAAQPGLSSADRANLQASFQALTNQLDQTVKGASAGDVNLLDGSSVPSVQVTADADGAKASLSAFDLSLGGPTVTLTGDSSLATASSAAATLSQVTSSLQSAGGVLDTLSNQTQQVTAHAAFVAQLGSVLGLANSAVNPPDGADGVRLQALQLQQLLSSQNNAIANAAPQSVLSLFKGG